MSEHNTDVYLCQVSETVSCGACCGLYNVADASFEALSQLLARRTRIFAALPRTMDAILDFGQTETARLGVPPMPEFHHCPYIGFIGENVNRVGCLLHPQATGNAGVDFRGLSHYGSMTCNMYFCPSHRNLPDDFKQLLRDMADDWYHYGLMISEPVLLDALHGEIQKRAGGVKLTGDLNGRPKNPALWREVFTLKTRWPFRAPGRPLANYFFNDPLYPKPAVEYARTSGENPGYDRIFRELHSEFLSPSALAAAKSHLDRLLDRLVAFFA